MKEPSTTESLVDTVSQIVTNYDQWNGPFERAQLPEKEALVGITDTVDRALYLTLTVSIDYQRDADRLWEKTRNLWETHRWIFEPEALVEAHGQEELISLFEERRMRFGKSDAEIWYTNAETLYREFDGSPLPLFDQYDRDAPAILNAVRSDSGFTYLGGQKIGPLWMRLIHEDVVPLRRIAEITIPVDVHIRRVTGELLGTSYTDADDDEIRAFWTEFCRDHGFDPVKVDQPLWLIGSHWNSWGREYLHAQLDGTDTDPATNGHIPPRSAYDAERAWIDAVAKASAVESDTVTEIVRQLRR